MAATRTVHRGSRGRFAGASAGKAEKIRVGRGYSRSATASNARPPVKGSARRSRIKSLAVRAGKSKAAKNLGKAAVLTGVSVGVGALGSRALASRPRGDKIAPANMSSENARALGMKKMAPKYMNSANAKSLGMARPKRTRLR